MASKNSVSNVMTIGSVPRHLKRLAIPMVIGVFAMISVNLVDTYFVGLIGTKELAAMSFTFPLIGLIINLCMGLGIGVMATTARLLGAGKNDEAEHISGQSLTLAFALSISLAVIGSFSQGLVFELMGAKPELLSLLSDYMRWWFVSLPFLVMVIICNSVMRAHGDSKTPMRLMIIAALINAILDPILIFGFLGAPRLELEGASIATLIARLSTFTYTMYYLFKRGTLSFNSLMPRDLIKVVKQVSSVGVPAALTNALTPLSAGLITALIALHGSETIAGYGLAIRFEGLFLLVPMVLGGALSPFVGQNWGARLNHRVVEALSWVRKISLIWGVGVCLALNLFASSLATGLSEDPKVQEAFSLYLCLISISYASQGVIYASNSTFNAINRPLKATLTSTLNSLILALPLAYVGNSIRGFMGIIIGLLIARVVSGLIANHWIWSIFADEDRQIALGPVEAKAKLYQLEAALPELALDLERMVSRLSHLPDIELVSGSSGELSYRLNGREIAYLFKDGQFDLCLPPQLRDAVVLEGWGNHHRREHNGCWVSHKLTEGTDLEALIRLICLAQAYLICLDSPASVEEAKSEIGKVCEVTRTMESRAELSELRLPAAIFQGLLNSIAAAREARGSIHA